MVMLVETPDPMSESGSLVGTGPSMSEVSTTDMELALMETGLIVWERSRTICAAAHEAVRTAQTLRLTAHAIRQRCEHVRALSQDAKRPRQDVSGNPAGP
jgi:hypothetical protein